MYSAKFVGLKRIPQGDIDQRSKIVRSAQICLKYAPGLDPFQILILNFLKRLGLEDCD